MISEGKIDIDLSRGCENGERLVRIRSSRRSDIGRILCGRTPAEALSLLPLIFGICGKAHRYAAAKAFRAGGLASVPDETAGQLLVLAENAREHLLRILLGWSHGRPESLKPIPVQDIMSLVTDMEAAVTDGTQGRLDGALVREIAARLERFLQDHLFGCPVEHWLQIRTLAGLESWIFAGQLLPQVYLAEICERQWQGVGAAKVDYLPAFPAKDLETRLKSRHARRFLSRPYWRGLACETGPLARWRTGPLLSRLIRGHGAGLLARNVARLVELAGIPALMRERVDCVQTLGDLALESPKTPEAGLCTGEVETARGRLVHAVKMQKGRIEDYHILAPTEWNFHPRGSAARGLQNLAGDRERDLMRQAHMLVQAIDPCVDFEVRIV